MAKLDVKALGLSMGIIWAVLTFLCGIFSMLFDWCTNFVELMGSIYFGYQATFLGSIIGGVWGFFDALVGGLVLAWLYNTLAAKKSE